MRGNYAAGLFAALLLFAVGTPADEAAGLSIRALIAPATESALASQMAGRIVKLGVREGSRFTKGELLLEFDCSVERARLSRARAELRAAEQTHESNRKLGEFNSVSDLDVALSAIGIEKARAELSIERGRVNRCTEHAPWDGRVAKLHVNEHDSVAESQALMDILDDTRLEIRLYVPSSWLSWLRKDAVFTLHVDENGSRYKARVTSLGARVDPVSHSLNVTGELVDDSEGLLSGMSGTAEFSRPAAD